ncbi:MAG: hypothetical protein R3A78_06085 [Polyangiales bacterium]
MATGYTIPPNYDSLIAKFIAFGDTRDQAADRMIGALESAVVDGIKTTIPMHIAILRSKAFRAGDYNTGRIPGWPTKG